MAMVKEKNIDGVQFSVAPFSAVEALKLKVYLIRTFGPALGQMLGSLQGLLSKDRPEDLDLGDVKVDGDALAKGIESLMGQLDEDRFIGLIRRMFSRLTAKLQEAGKTLTFVFSESYFDNSMDKVFSEHLFTIYPVMGLVLEANYPDFFDKTVRNIGSLIRKTPGSAPENETGTSGSENSGA
jgi:hypothetical protein